MRLQPDATLQHRYVIRRALGEGGMGTSYLAWDLLREASVTLKILRAPLPELIEAIRAEFSALRGVVHPHLCHVHDFGGVRGEDGALTYFYTAEYVEGITLDRYVQGLPWQEAAKPIAQALDALCFLHRLSVRHGDFKPDNILVGPDGGAVLIDLGCSQPLDTPPGADISGTPGFIAPELMRGQSADHRADLYAVGVTLKKIVPSLAGPIPERITKLIARLLQEHPRDRPSDVIEVIDEIRTERVISTPPCAQPARLLGRAGEMATFEQTLNTLLTGREGPRGLFVIGPEGVGRTRLLQEMKWTAQLRCAVAEGHAARTSPVLSMLRRATKDPTIPNGISGVLRAREMLAAMPEPMVLILDDAHLAPEEDRELLHWLLRSLERTDPFLVVCSAPTAPPLSLGGVETISIDPLSEREVAAWTADIVPNQRVADIMRLTGGFPASIHALVSMLRTGDGMEQSLSRLGSKAPLSERRAEGIQALEPERRRLLGLFAVLDGALDDADLTRLNASRDALGHLVQRGFVQAGQAGFRLVRGGEAPRILEVLGPETAAALHRQAADRLRERLSPGTLELADASEITARLVHHLCLGGLVDEAHAILTSTKHFHVERPASWAPAAEAVARARPSSELSLLAASIEEAAGHFNAALSLLAALLRTRPAAPWRARARIQAGACYLRLGNIRRAVHYLSRALSGESRADDRARALDLLARAHIRRGTYAEALACARRGIEGASAEGAVSGASELRVVADLNDSIGLAATYLGDAETARRHLRTAARLHEETGDRRAQARSADYQALNEFRAGNTLEAAQGYRAALEMAERHGTSRQVASAVLNVGTSSHQLGDLGQALSSYERALRMAIALGLPSTEATLRYNLAKLYADIGLFERAEAEGRRGEVTAREAGARLLVGAIAMEMGNIALLSGDSARAIEQLRRARDVFAAQSAVREVVEVDLHLAEAELKAGDLAASALMIERAAAAAFALRASDLSAQLAMMRGRASLAQEQTSAAIDHLEEAARLARACGQRVLLAIALGWLSAACERDGATFLARRYKAEARELWERAAASLPRHFRDAFWAHPARAGARGAAEGPPAPSPRERKLERLLAINKKLNSSLDVKEVLSCAIDSAIELTGSERGFVILAPEGGREGEVAREGELYVAAARNMDHERIGKSHLKFSRGIAEQVISKAEPIITSSAQEDPRFAGHASVHKMRLESVISAPICAPDGVLGALYLDHRFRKALFSAEDVDLVMAFADQVAIALTNARRRDELARRTEELLEERQRIEQRVIGQVEEIDRLTEQVRASQEALGHRYDYSHIIGRSAAMQKVFKMLDRVTDSNECVVIQGESGTGKELIAKAICYNGPRRGKPFIPINCGAMPEGLLESELFGHVEGAFTNATRNKAGLFAAASGGTLFLDEIGEMSPGMQAKLLRALQERVVRPIGGTASVRVDVRVICATNRRLRDEVARGLFRMDLFYRIGIVEITLPPLRERVEDIPLLAAHLLDKIAREHERPPLKLTQQAVRALMMRRWPGNVRELENALRYAMLFAEGDRITPADLLPPSEPIEDVAGSPILDRRRLEAEDIARIKAAIQAANGNVSEAARTLGMPRASLYRKLSRFELQQGARPEPLPRASPSPPPPGKRRRGAVSPSRHRPPSGRRPR